MLDGNDHNDRNNSDNYCGGFDVADDHTSYLSFFVHGQNFWRIKFTPKNANFSR